MGRSQPWEGLRDKYSGGGGGAKAKAQQQKELRFEGKPRKPVLQEGEEGEECGRWEGAGLRGCGGVGLVSAWRGCGVVQGREEKGVSLRLSDFLLGYTLR